MAWMGFIGVQLLRSEIFRLTATTLTFPVDTLAKVPELMMQFARLLTDIEMPNNKRLELADRLLQLEPGLKILFMSAIDGASSRSFGWSGNHITAQPLDAAP
jgi:CheY-like chemotaxis protein